MSARTWNKDRATGRIDAGISGLPLSDIQIKDYVRDTSLSKSCRHGRVSSSMAYTSTLTF